MTAVVLWAAGGLPSAGSTDYGSPANTGTAYVLTTTEIKAQVPWRTAGVMSGLYARVTANGLSTASTITFRVSGADGNQALSISGGATGDFQDLTHTDTLAGAGELVAFKVVVGTGGTSTFTAFDIAMIFTPTTGTVTRYQCTGGGGTQAANLSRYQSLTGNTDTSSTTGTESREQFKFKSAGTLQKLYAYFPTNTLSTATTTVRIRKNTANGNQSLSISAGATGLFEDTTNTDTIASGDLANYVITTASGGTGSLTHGNVGVELATTDGATYYIAATSGTMLVAAAATAYSPISGIANPQSTENNVKGQSLLARTLSNLEIQITGNVPTGASTVRVRVNAANGNGVISVAGGATGYFEDVTNSDAVGATDYVNYQIVGGTGSGNVTLNSVGCKVAETVTASPLAPSLIRSQAVTRAAYW